MKINKLELFNHLLKTTIDQEDYEIAAQLRDNLPTIDKEDYYEIEDEYTYGFKITDIGLSIYKIYPDENELNLN